MRRFPSPDWLLPTLAAWVMATLADIATAKGSPMASAFLWSAGLAAACALVSAAALTVASAGLSLLPRMVRTGVWIAAGLGLGAWLADELWAFSKIGTRDTGLAVATLAICGAAGLALGGLAAAVQPGRPGKMPWIFGLHLRFRLGGAVLLLGAAGGMIFFDRTEYRGLYEEVHAGLQIASLFLAAVAALLLWEPARGHLSRTRAGFAAGAALAALLVFLTTGESSMPAIARIDSRPYPSLALELMRRLTDLDGDGYSSLLAGGDCAPFDPAISPGAAEVPGNGVDDNCLGGDLPSRADYDPAIENRPMPEQPPAFDIVLVTVDSTRADRLRQAGYGRPVMPRISGFADGSLVFLRAFATGSWTSIAMPSLMRSTYARRLTWTGYMETSKFRLVRLPFAGKLRDGEKPNHVFLLPTGERRRPLAWWLRRRGLHTIGVVNDGFSRMLSGPVGTGLGFDVFLEVEEEADRRRGDAATTDLALKAVRDAVKNGREPFFLWVHYFGPHTGRFRPPGKQLKYLDVDGNLYDDRLVYTDAQVGRLLDGLDALATSLPRATVISADHGEEIRGKKTMHGSSVSEELLRVPLVLRAPGAGHRIVDVPVSTADIAPTLLGLAGVPPLPDLDGVDLLAVARGGSPPRRLGLVADNWSINKRGEFKRDQVAVFDGRWKLVQNRRTGTLSFEPQAGDPATGRAGVPDPATAGSLERMLERYLDESVPMDYAGLDEEIDLSYGGSRR